MYGASLRRNAPAKGLVPRVNGAEDYRSFVEEVRPEAILIGVREVRSIVAGHGETAGSWFPDDTTVITKKLPSEQEAVPFTWEGEAKRVEMLNPDYHIPVFERVDAGDDEFFREDGCKRAAIGGTWMRQRLPEEIGIIPTMKGATLDERAICDRVAAELQPDMVAVDHREYSFREEGDTQSIFDHLEAISSETAGKPVLLLGDTPVDVLDDLPGDVVASAYHGPQTRASTPAEMRDGYLRRVDEAEDAVGDTYGGNEETWAGDGGS